MESYSSMSIRNYTLHISFPRNNCLFCDIDIDQFPFKNKKKKTHRAIMWTCNGRPKSSYCSSERNLPLLDSEFLSNTNTMNNTQNLRAPGLSKIRWTRNKWCGIEPRSDSCLPWLMFWRLPTSLVRWILCRGKQILFAPLATILFEMKIDCSRAQTFFCFS